MSGLIKVVVVDDHKSIRDSLEMGFNAKNGFEVVASVDCADVGVAACHIKRPELVITDVCTARGASGLAAAEKIIKSYPEIKVIVTSGFNEITYAMRAKELGAHAFVYKELGLEYYLEVARLVLAGEYIFPEPRTIPTPEGEAPFTDREMIILNLLCRHKKVSDIAAELFISELTVRRHIRNMLEKSDFSTIMDLVLHVVSNGWINPNY